MSAATSVGLACRGSSAYSVRLTGGGFRLKGDRLSTLPGKQETYIPIVKGAKGGRKGRLTADRWPSEHHPKG